jgi:hypothetical protein
MRDNSFLGFGTRSGGKKRFQSGIEATLRSAIPERNQLKQPFHEAIATMLLIRPLAGAEKYFEDPHGKQRAQYPNFERLCG